MMGACSACGCEIPCGCPPPHCAGCMAAGAQLIHAEVVIESQKRSYEAAHDRANDAEHNLRLAEAVVDAVRVQERCSSSACSNGDLCRDCATRMDEAVAAYDAGRRK